MGRVKSDYRITCRAECSRTLKCGNSRKVTAAPGGARVGRGGEAYVGAAARDASDLKGADDGRAKGKRTRLNFRSVLAGGVGKRILAKPG